MLNIYVEVSSWDVCCPFRLLAKSVLHAKLAKYLCITPYPHQQLVIPCSHQTGSLTCSDESPPSYVNHPSTSSMSDRNPDPNSSSQPASFLSPGPPPVRSHSNLHLFHPQHQRLPASPTGPPPHLQLPDSPTILALGTTTHFQGSGGLYNNGGGSGSPHDSFANGSNHTSGHDVSIHHSHTGGSGPQQHSPVGGRTQGPSSASGSPHLLVNAAFQPPLNLNSQGPQGRSSHLQQPLHGQVMAHQNSPGMSTWQPHATRSEISPKGVVPGGHMFAHEATALSGAQHIHGFSPDQQPRTSHGNNGHVQVARQFSMDLRRPDQHQQQHLYDPRDSVSSPHAPLGTDPGEQSRVQSSQNDRGGGRTPAGGERDSNGQSFRPLHGSVLSSFGSPGGMNQGSLGGGGHASPPYPNSSRLHPRSMSMPQQPDQSQRQQGFSEGSLLQQQQQQQRQLHQQQLQQQQQQQSQEHQQSQQQHRYSHQQHLSQQQQHSQHSYPGARGGAAAGGELPTLMEKLSTEPPATRQRTEARSNGAPAFQQTPQGKCLYPLTCSTQVC